MQRIYAPRDLLEAEMLRGMLHNEGIAAHIAGRDLLGAIGDLPVDGLLSLVVDDAHAATARELIGAYNAALPLSGDEPEDFTGVLIC